MPSLTRGVKFGLSSQQARNTQPNVDDVPQHHHEDRANGPRVNGLPPDFECECSVSISDLRSSSAGEEQDKEVEECLQTAFSHAEGTTMVQSQC